MALPSAGHFVSRQGVRRDCLRHRERTPRLRLDGAGNRLLRRAPAKNDEAGDSRLAIGTRRARNIVLVDEKPLHHFVYGTAKAALDLLADESLVVPFDRDAAFGEKTVQDLPKRGAP